MFLLAWKGSLLHLLQPLSLQRELLRCLLMARFVLGSVHAASLLGC